jgi:hypothetical protein
LSAETAPSTLGGHAAPDVEHPPAVGASLEQSTNSSSAATHEWRAAPMSSEDVGARTMERLGGAVGSSTVPDPARPSITTSLPTGADKSGVSSKAISIPQGSGKIDGMGESFSTQLSTGVATFSVPIAIPAARGGAQPSLSLSYSSGSGLGVAGQGWDLGAPFIAHQTDRGIPGYRDGAGFDPNQDTFVFNGGQELVPICTVTPELACNCEPQAQGGCLGGGIEGEVMPPWSAGAMYFRPRVEGSFLRFFLSPDKKTWRVQDKSGVSSASAPPRPTNVVVYRYAQDGGMAYLSDIFHTTPRADATTADLAKYAHHVHLSYEQRSDPTFSYRSGFRIDQRLRLGRVDIASKPFNGDASSPRRMVRRYHLSYEVGRHASLLSSVQVEGRCANGGGSDPNAIVEEQHAQQETDSGLLPESTGCPRLPPMRFGYSHVTPFSAEGQSGGANLLGYEPFDGRVRTIVQSPRHSFDEELTDLFDINSDALPDVLVTAPGVYGGGHGVFFNGVHGIADGFGAVQQMAVRGVLGADSNTVKLSNLNLAPLDIDGDATIDLLHMPALKSYAVYRPELLNGQWSWVGRAVETASQQNSKIDFGKDTLDTRVVDVNFDGLVDVVVSTGLEFQTFFSLGRYPGGDGQFGSATLASARTAPTTR